MVQASLLGAIGIKRFVEANNGTFLASTADGRIVRGHGAVEALKKEGFAAKKWEGTGRDKLFTPAQWAKVMERNQTYLVWIPKGTEVCAA